MLRCKKNQQNERDHADPVSNPIMLTR